MKAKKALSLLKEYVKERINFYDEDKQKQYTYHVEIKSSGCNIEVTPMNGHTFYCIEDLVQFCTYHRISFYVTVDESTPVFRMYFCK